MLSILQRVKLSHNREALVLENGTVNIPSLPHAGLTRGDVLALHAALPGAHPEAPPAPPKAVAFPKGVALRNFCCMVYGNGITWWSYQSERDTIGDMAESGYFDEVAGMLKQGDIVYLKAADGCALRAVIRHEEGAVGVGGRVRLVALS